ncbi:MAG TPA: protein translocase subunit SecD [Mycobacteriales bacterium]|nr:protein translocase subunit SecD [Mycobacteriales bacterium]
MAQATKQRPGRTLAGMALLLVLLYVGLFLGPSPKPVLGLDLRGGTQVTLTAKPLVRHSITKGALDQAVNIIRDRVLGLGVGGADISTQGNNHIIVSVPGKGRDKIVNTVGQTALLRFRQVLQVGPYSPQPTATATTSPSVSVAPTTTATSKPTSKATKKSKGDAISSALLAAKPSPSASSSATPSPTATATSTASPSPGSTASAGDEPLPGSEAPTLTDALKSSFANWDCAKHKNPTNGNDVPSDYIIACDPQSQLVELLGPATVQGTDVKSANAGLATNGVGWQVNLSFTGSGSGKWLAITKKAYDATGSTDSGFASGCAPPKGCNAVAIVLDGVVQSAPAIQSAGGIPGGLAQITGNYDQTGATNLANVLKYGSLPLKFVKSDVTTVSATLGSRQLRGGLIAGAIGLGLVILFSLFYYRALGIVTVGSLAVSGGILYAVTSMLGHSSVGYTLSLPGIAGFIVAVGITADSFVVYFERLRDEVREGRRLRSAVDRAWPRARRTIMSADTVSLLAAIVLYVVSIGDVRGFAFTLGLSTLSDLVIVFFFTRPLLQVLGRRKAFDSGKAWTGIGKARAGVTQEAEAEPPTRRVRRREA